MKKEYIMPRTEVMECEMVEMIAATTLEQGNATDGTNVAESRKHFFLDDDEDF